MEQAFLALAQDEEDQLDYDELLLDQKINPPNETNFMGVYAMASAAWTQIELQTGRQIPFSRFWSGEDDEYDRLVAQGIVKPR